jgi:hypothetical protein
LRELGTMSFIRGKRIKGHLYYYRVKNEWKDGKVHQIIIEYIGKTKPPSA